MSRHVWDQKGQNVPAFNELDLVKEGPPAKRVTGLVGRARASLRKKSRPALIVADMGF